MEPSEKPSEFAPWSTQVTRPPEAVALIAELKSKHGAENVQALPLPFPETKLREFSA